MIMTGIPLYEVPMSHHASPDGESDRAADIRSEPALPEAVQTTETYETEGGTVFYDAQNPLAWVQTDTTVPLTELA
jgi:hypothetical protein